MKASLPSLSKGGDANRGALPSCSEAELTQTPPLRHAALCPAEQRPAFNPEPVRSPCWAFYFFSPFLKAMLAIPPQPPEETPAAPPHNLPQTPPKKLLQHSHPRPC